MSATDVIIVFYFEETQTCNSVFLGYPLRCDKGSQTEGFKLLLEGFLNQDLGILRNVRGRVFGGQVQAP